MRVGDDMRAQHELITENLAWTISRCGWRVYGRAADLRVGGTLPDMVKRAAPIAGTAKNTMHDFLFTETCRRLAVLGPAADPTTLELSLC